MTPLRSDAARSRARILEAARAHDPHTLRLNEIAREAGVGVGTVYRHFPSVETLVEALSTETIDTMLGAARRAAAEPDAATAFALYLREALRLQLSDGGLQQVLLSPADELEDVRRAKHEIFATLTELVGRARQAGVVRADLTIEDLTHLLCGIEHAIRLGGGRSQTAFVDVLLAGLSPR